jgi:hypothetical protein
MFKCRAGTDVQVQGRDTNPCIQRKGLHTYCVYRADWWNLGFCMCVREREREGDGRRGVNVQAQESGVGTAAGTQSSTCEMPAVAWLRPDVPPPPPSLLIEEVTLAERAMPCLVPLPVVMHSRP